MPSKDVHGTRAEAETVRSLAVAALEDAGAPPDEASVVADSFVDASLRGIDSHGVNLLPEYLARIRAVGWTMPNSAHVVARHGGIALLDGGGGLGQVTATRAMDLAVDLAASHGIGAVSVRNSSHFGAAGYFARRALNRDMLGVVMTNASPAIAPHGGAEQLLGSNPWAVAVPSREPCDVVLDISNSVVARSWIRLAAQEGREIPIGWALDGDGRPTTDATAALRGTLQAMAGHKGYGIAFMIDCLAGILSGSAFGPGVLAPFAIQVDAPSKPLVEPQGVGHLMIAIDVSAVRPLEDFKADVSKLIATLRASRPAVGFESVLTPGEPECQAHAERSRTGIPVRPEVLAMLEAAGLFAGADKVRRESNRRSEP